MSIVYRYEKIGRQITLYVTKNNENSIIIQRLSTNVAEQLSTFMAKDLPLVYNNE